MFYRRRVSKRDFHYVGISNFIWISSVSKFNVGICYSFAASSQPQKPKTQPVLICYLSLKHNLYPFATTATFCNKRSNNSRAIMARTPQKNTVVKAARSQTKLTYNGVALPTDVAERRRLRNKLSAKVHREKKKDALEGAKQEVIACNNELTQLKSELTEVSLI